MILTHTEQGYGTVHWHPISPKRYNDQKLGSSNLYFQSVCVKDDIVGAIEFSTTFLRVWVREPLGNTTKREMLHTSRTEFNVT